MNMSIDISSHFPLFYLYGISSGIVLMAALYNAVLFIYNRKMMFVYYAFMQISIVFNLFYLSHVVKDVSWMISIDKILLLMTIIGAIFAISFTRSFLETRKYVPRFDKFLLIMIALLVFDIALALLNQSIIDDLIPCFHLLSLLLIVGYWRLSQGFKPAFYFLLGWSVLISSITLSLYGKPNWSDSEYLRFIISNPILLGSPLEAMLFAFGLFYTVKTTENEKKIQEQILIQQAKLVYLGEMLGNISHQWRQPLTNLSYVFMNIKASSGEELYIKKKADEGIYQLEFMAETIENFRNFYRPDSEKEDFALHDATRCAVEIMQNELDYENIFIHIHLHEDTQMCSFKNQYIQVVLNILSNAKEILISSNVHHKLIQIELFKNKMLISDNGGGIPEQQLHRIFEPYFSTKSKNSGIGLYMSKIIIENNMGGEIKASNTPDGALFEIIF